MDHRSLITNNAASPIELLAKIVERVSFGRVRLQLPDLTEERREELRRQAEEDVRAMIEEIDREIDEKYADERPRIEQQNLFFDLLEDITAVTDRMFWLANRVSLGYLTEPEEIHGEVQACGVEVAHIFGGFFESYHDIDIPDGFEEMWQEWHHQDLEVWWEETYWPTVEYMRRAVTEWTERTGHHLCDPNTW